MSRTDDLTAAIADLAEAGMAFTTDIRSDGKKTYIVDSVDKQKNASGRHENCTREEWGRCA
jgi:hypothetical protein